MNLHRLLEFFIVGVVFGIAEDLIAIRLATGADINFKMVGIVFLAAFPFAVISELVIDHDKVQTLLRKHFGKKLY